jgi:hypothetical protein
MTVEAQPNTESNIPSTKSHRAKEVAQKTFVGFGITLAAGGFLGACMWPWVGIDKRTYEENLHADKARSDGLNAILALSGSTLIDNSSSKSVLFQQFLDGDTLAVKTDNPDPDKAREYLQEASDELRSTYKNTAISIKLGELAHKDTIDLKTVITDTQHIRHDIPRGHMISWADVEIELGLLATIPVGLALANKVSSAPERNEYTKAVS